MKIRRTGLCVFCLALMPLMPAHAGNINSDAPQQSSPSAFQQELIRTQRAFQDALERGDAEYVRNAGG